MRRYSPSYFVSTGIKGLWRNGFMTLASIAILCSCLVVMGCFALLVSNIDYNLKNIDGLNKIVAFADVDAVINAEKKNEKASETESESETSDAAEDIKPLETEGSQNEDVIDPTVESKETKEAETLGEEAENAFFANFEAQLKSLSEFTDLKQASSSLISVERAFDVLTEKISATENFSDSMAERYNANKKNFEYIKARIEILSDIEKQIKNTSGIDETQVSFVSKSAALAEQKEKYEKYVNLYEALDEDDNPFPDSFTVTYDDVDGVSLIQWDLEHIDGIYSVVCRSELAQNISSLKSGVIMIFSWLLVILFVVSLFVISNTIKISVYARRDEIGVMRYIGATNFFITTPFVIEGGTIGLISGALSFVIVKYAYAALAKNIMESYQIISVVSPGSVNVFLIAGFLIFGVLTGIIASAISIRKYLKA